MASRLRGARLVAFTPRRPRFFNGRSLGTLAGSTTTRKPRIIVGITGASGSVLGIRILETLRQNGVESHLVMSKWAEATLKYETDYTTADVIGLADVHYGNKDMSAAISSGSHAADGMIIAPCSMRTLAAIRAGFGDNLICRAADVTIKEHRKLVLVVRETPLSPIHLENMLELSRIGVTIFPPVPAFYIRPQCIDDIVDHTVGRALDYFGIDTKGFERWTGFAKKGK